MLKALSELGPLVRRMLESQGTPIDDRHSIFVCPCTGSIGVIEDASADPAKGRNRSHTTAVPGHAGEAGSG